MRDGGGLVVPGEEVGNMKQFTEGSILTRESAIWRNQLGKGQAKISSHRYTVLPH